jgi:quercetin dioxygenase-like cupin family protein
MNVQQLHPAEKEVSGISLFKGQESETKSLHISRGAEISKHQSKTPALLICIIGEVVFEDGNGIKETLKQGDYVNIEPLVDHWMKSVTDSHLLLIK